jgi:hypothetical protein
MGVMFEEETDQPLCNIPRHLKKGLVIIMPANAPQGVYQTTRLRTGVMMIHE